MELIDYWHFVQRWFMLIVGGTLLAAILSYGVVLLRARAAMPTYRNTAAVMVHYVLPFGAPYNPTVSLQSETFALKQRATDPATLAAVRRSTHVSRQQITTITALMDPQIQLFTIQVDGHTPTATATFAQGLATYLAGLQSEKIQNEAGTLRHILAGQVAAARAKWMAALIHFYLVHPQLLSHPTAQNSTTLARLQATLDILQQDYQSVSSQYASLALVPLPAATVERGQTSTVTAPSTSRLQAVLPPTVLAFFLMIGLAAVLGYLGVRSHVRV